MISPVTCNSHIGFNLFLGKTSVTVFLEFNVKPLSSLSLIPLSSIFCNFALLLTTKTDSSAYLMFVIFLSPKLVPSSSLNGLESYHCTRKTNSMTKRIPV